jgi:hypothetical protein
VREEPTVPVFFPGTDHEVRCDEPPRPVSELMDLPRCSSSTRTCIGGCDYDLECIYDCLVTDQTPAASYKPVPEWDANCVDCYEEAVEHCGAGVCRELQKTFFCCWAEHACGEEACSPCEAEGYAYEGCMTDKAFSCYVQGEVLQCFPPP